MDASGPVDIIGSLAIAELSAIASAVASGDGATAMANASPLALAALQQAHREIEKWRRSGRSDREIPIRVAVAISMRTGIQLALPSRGDPATTTILGPCDRCEVGMGERCRTPGGMPCRPHVGRRRSR